MNNVIVNLRGTSGSGKSTLVKTLIGLCHGVDLRIVAGRKQPYGYTMEHDGRRLFIPGHYASQCGGCDTLGKYIPDLCTPRIIDGEDPNSYHLTFGLVRKYFAEGYDVLFEGLLISGDVRHTKALHQDSLPINVVAFDLPVEFCIESVVQRRALKGNTEPFNDKNTRDKHRLLSKCVDKLAAAGLNVFREKSRDEALARVKSLLGFQADSTPVN